MRSKSRVFSVLATLPHPSVAARESCQQHSQHISTESSTKHRSTQSHSSIVAAYRAAAERIEQPPRALRVGAERLLPPQPGPHRRRRAAPAATTALLAAQRTRERREPALLCHATTKHCVSLRQDIARSNHEQNTDTPITP